MNMKKIISIAVVVSFFLMKGYAQSDTPCNAPFLIVNADSCGFVVGTTDGAIYQNDALNGGTPSCAFPGSPDVWYRFIVPASGAVAITSTEGTITDGGMAIYSGSCSNLQFIACDDDDASNFMPVIDRSDFQVGDTIYVRFWKAAGAGTGTFNICAITSHSDCRSATFVCNNRHFPRNTYGPGSNVDAFSTDNCGITEYQSQWLTFTFLTSGSFTFTIYPDSLAEAMYPDYDWILFQNNDPAFCSVYNSTFVPSVCNASSSYGYLGSTGLGVSGVSNSVPPGPGNPFCPVQNVNAGDTYYLFMNNFTTSSTGYNIVFGGTATMDCNLTVDVVEHQKPELKTAIYPNPATDEINVETDISLIGSTYTLYDLLGNSLRSGILKDEKTSIALHTLSQGIYFLSIGRELKQQYKIIKN